MELFQTQAQEPKRKFDFWYDVVERSYANCEGQVEGRAQFDASLGLAKAGQLELTEISSRAIRYVRTARHVRLGQQDDLFLSLMVSGEVRFAQNDRQAIQTAGEILIFDTARPYEFDYPGEYRSILLKMPRPTLESRLSQTKDIGGTVLAADSPHTRMIASILQNMSAIAHDEELPPDLIAPALDMIAGTIARIGGVDLRKGDPHELMLSRIKHYMEAHLAEEDMSLERISADQNISVRSICRLFAQEGVTPMAWLQKRRLAIAFARLTDGRSKSVTEAALDTGFKDLSHFGRSFRKTYGVTPREIVPPRSAS